MSRTATAEPLDWYSYIAIGSEIDSLLIALNDLDALLRQQTQAAAMRHPMGDRQRDSKRITLELMESLKTKLEALP